MPPSAEASTAPPRIGVLAIQGDFEAHARTLERAGAQPRLVRTPGDLEGLEGLVIPGGESTTISQGIEREALAEPLRALVARGAPVLGTCAGLILLDRDHLGVLDVSTVRNAFGRQVRSFEADLRLDWPPAVGREAEKMRAVFIRAPWVRDAGEAVEILAEVDGHPVAVLEGDVLAVAFHPELTGDERLHRWVVERARGRRGTAARRVRA